MILQTELLEPASKIVQKSWDYGAALGLAVFVMIALFIGIYFMWRENNKRRDQENSDKATWGKAMLDKMDAMHRDMITEKGRTDKHEWRLEDHGDRIQKIETKLESK